MMVESMSKQEIFSLEKKKLEMAAKKLQLEQQRLELEMMKMDWQYNSAADSKTRRLNSKDSSNDDDHSIRDRSSKQRFEKLNKSRKESDRSSSGSGKPHRSDQLSSKSDHVPVPADGLQRSDGRPGMGMRSSSWYVRREGLISHEADDDRRHAPKSSGSRRPEDSLRSNSSHDGVTPVDSRRPRRRGSSVESPAVRESDQQVYGYDAEGSRSRRRRGSSVEAPQVRRSSSVERPRRRESCLETSGKDRDYSNSNHSDERRRQRSDDSNRRKTGESYDDRKTTTTTTSRRNPVSGIEDDRDSQRREVRSRRTSISGGTVHSHADDKRRYADDRGKSPARSSASVSSSRRRDNNKGHSSSPERDDDDGKTVGTAKTSSSSFKSVRDITWPDGRRYCGGWYDGKCHGKGTYIWPDGSKYIGQYKDGIRHGVGTFIGKDGSKYDGEFRDGKRCGRGVQFNPNGSVYHDGKWKDNKPST